MRVPRLIPSALVIAAVAAAASVTPAGAAPRRSDEQATHAYLLALIAEQRSGASLYQADLAAYAALAVKFGSECPGILTGTPLGSIEGDTNGPGEHADLEVAEELTNVVLSASEPVGHRLDVRFYEAVKGLRWSNRKLTRLLHELALEQELQSAEHAPDLCADLRYWVASGFLKASAGTQSYDKEVERISSTATIERGPGEHSLDGIDALLAHRLRPYESSDDHKLARRAFPPEPKLSDPAFEPFIKAIQRVYTTLGRQTGS